MIKHVPPGYYENIPDLIEVIKNIYGSTQDKKSTTNVSKALEMVLARLGTQWISTKYVQGFGTPIGIPQKAMDSYTYRQLI